MQRYLLLETLGLYLLGVAALCIFLSIDKLTGWAEFLIRHEAGPATVGTIMLYTLPDFLRLAMPIAVVFAVLLATGRLAKDSELKAAYAAGVRPLALLVPLLVLGLLVSGLTLLNNGYLQPYTKDAHDRIVDSFFYTQPPAETQSNVAFRSEDQGIYFASKVQAEPDSTRRAELTGVLVLQPDGSSLSAPSGVWDSEARIWTLQDAERVSAAGERELLGELSLPFDVDRDASASLVEQELLTLSELGGRIEEARVSGALTRPLRYDFHARIADAFSAVSFALIAGILGLRLHGRSSGFAWVIVLLVLFWVLWTLSGSLFEEGVLSPLAAAWLTSGLVGAVGLATAWLRLR